MRKRRFMYYTEELDNLLGEITTDDKGRVDMQGRMVLIELYWLCYHSAWVGALNTGVCSNRVLAEVCGCDKHTIRNWLGLLEQRGYINRMQVVYPASAWRPEEKYLRWQFDEDCKMLGRLGVERSPRKPQLIEADKLTAEQKAVVPEGETGPFFIVEYIYPVKWSEVFCPDYLSGNGFQRPPTWDFNKPVVYRSGYRETYLDNIQTLDASQDLFVDGRAKIGVVMAIVNQAIPIFGSSVYSGYVDRLDDEDKYALQDILTPLLEGLGEGWTIEDYFEWVKTFIVNPEYAEPTSIYDYFSDLTVKLFLRYMKTLHTSLRAYQHERELIDAYYEAFPRELKYKAAGYEKVLGVVQAWLKEGREWHSFWAIIQRALNRDTAEDPVNVFCFELGNMKKKLRVKPGKLSLELWHKGCEWAGIDTSARVTPEPFKTEHWLLQQYRKLGAGVFKDKKWSEADEGYGYAEYLQE